MSDIGFQIMLQARLVHQILCIVFGSISVYTKLINPRGLNNCKVTNDIKAVFRPIETLPGIVPLMLLNCNFCTE